MVCLAACVQTVQAVDCNGNSVEDSLDISRGTCLDCNGNGIPDECECVKPLDWDNDTDVDGADLLAFEPASRAPWSRPPPAAKARTSTATAISIRSTSGSSSSATAARVNRQRRDAGIDPNGGPPFGCGHDREPPPSDSGNPHIRTRRNPDDDLLATPVVFSTAL